LSLTGNHNCRSISLANNTTLLQLNLSENVFSESDTANNNESTTYGIGDMAAKALAQNTTLKELYLAGNLIGSMGAQALADNTTLIRLDLSDNLIGNSGAKALARNTTLVQLNLQGNKWIGEEGKLALKNSPNPYLRNLNF
jgi:hypothetical protein